MADPIAITPAKLQLPVEVIGSDLYGQQFFESTRTVTIHRHGVSLLLENKVGPDSELILRNPETNEEAIAFVVGQAREDNTAMFTGWPSWIRPSIYGTYNSPLGSGKNSPA